MTTVIYIYFPASVISPFYLVVIVIVVILISDLNYIYLFSLSLSFSPFHWPVIFHTQTNIEIVPTHRLVCVQIVVTQNVVTHRFCPLQSSPVLIYIYIYIQIYRYMFKNPVFMFYYNLIYDPILCVSMFALLFVILFYFFISFPFSSFYSFSSKNYYLSPFPLLFYLGLCILKSYYLYNYNYILLYICTLNFFFSIYLHSIILFFIYFFFDSF